MYYAMNGLGLGRVRTKFERELLDAAAKAKRVSRFGSPIRHSAVADMQELLNEELDFGWVIEVDGIWDHSICAGLDELYASTVLDNGTVISKNFVTELKKEIGCPTTVPYPPGTVPRDYLVREDEITSLDLRSTKTKPKPKRTSFCEPRESMCFDSHQVKDSAQTKCQYGVIPDEVPGGCVKQSRIGPYGTTEVIKLSASAFHPCDIQDLPVCPQTLTELRQSRSRSRSRSMPAEDPITVAPPELPPPPAAPSPQMPPPPPSQPSPDEPSQVSPGPVSDIVADYGHLTWGQGPDPDVAGLIREYLNPAMRRMGYNLIGENSRFNMRVCAAIKRAFPKSFPAFNCMKAIPNPDQWLSRAVSGLGADKPYCEPKAYQCFDSYQERDTVITQCQYGEKPDRGTDPCLLQQRFMSNNLHQYDPCDIKNFPLCGETKQEATERILSEQDQQQFVSDPTSADTPSTIYADTPSTIYDTEVVSTIYDEPSEEYLAPPPEEEEPEDRSMMVFGVLAAVVVGGGAIYLMTRKKKR